MDDLDPVNAARLLGWLQRVRPDLQAKIVRETPADPSAGLVTLGKLQGFDALERRLTTCIRKGSDKNTAN